MPFSIFVGIDNHGRTILFGYALLRNETVATFRWLMKTFVALMKKSPKTIITDQDPWMTKAIAIEMPLVKHAFCIWHITTKFSGWFTSILRVKYMAWCAEFYRLYKVDNIEDFEYEWPLVISKFNLQENKHIMGLYEIRKFWAPCYLRGYFFGGMRTTRRSESINSFVKRFTSSRLCLTQLVKQVDLAIEAIGQKQSHNVMLDTYRGSYLRTLSPLEEQVYGVFTNFAFKKFQGEFEMATQYKVCAESQRVFIVQHYDYPHSQEHKVLWDGIVAECSCRNFEFWGIICRHVLTLFLHKDCFQIPLTYLPLRWYRDEYHEIGSSSLLGGAMSEIEILSVGVEDTVRCPPSSMPKGRPKNKRDKSSKELAHKQVKTCKFCKRTGHNITTCRDKENSDPNVVSSNIGKKRKLSQGNKDLNPVYTLKF
ncbi:protein FAR1-RELATED SEQUENCE 11-like [Euphorbia lathyris]|uniref:protein FAR1-RELATED SEQUENCE 11-like n=1 Tax=Euphorbia lathyris TaxID=212925 RepID=UPI0033140C31